MRVLQLVDTMTVGGAQRLQLTYARMAVAHGEEPLIVSLRAFLGSPLPGQLQDAGARVVAMPGKGLKDIHRTLRLAHFLRSERVDVMHAHLGYAIMVGAVVGALAHVPVVATLHSTKPDAKQWLEAFALRHGTKRIIAVGTAVAEAYRGHIGTAQMVVLQNPVNEPPVLAETERVALRTEIAGDPRRPLIVTAGRLAPDKGYADLLTVIDEVRKSHPDSVLAIAGMGRLQAELEARITDCALQDHVRLLGLRDDLPQILASADLYVSASLREGLPITTLEAMAAALPIVATRTGDVPELLSEGRGVLVAPGQRTELLTAILERLDDWDGGKRMGAAARDYVLRRHSPEAWYAALRKIYAEVAPVRTQA